MTEKQAWIVGLSAAAFWLLVLRGASALKIGLKYIQLISVNGDTATMQVMLYVQNPLIASVLVRSVSGTVSIMGIPVGVIDYPINKRIEARSISYIPVQVEISYSKLGDAIWANIMSGSVQTLSIELDGKITAGEQYSISVPIRKLWTYSDIINRQAE